MIIAGSRSFTDITLVESYLLKAIGYGVTEVVSGAARGADICGEIAAKTLKVKVTQFPANWKLHGKAAGPIRNREMAEYADVALVFWDTVSPGSKNMIDTMVKLQKPVIIVPFNEENS